MKKFSEAKAQRERLAAAFRKSADSLQRQAEEKRHPAIAEQNLTARRARIATSMGNDADYLEKIQTVMAGMASDIEARQLPRALLGITSRGMVESIIAGRYHRPGLHLSTVREVLKATQRKQGLGTARRSIIRLQKKLGAEDYWLELPRLANVEAMALIVRAAEGCPGVYLNGTLPGLNTSIRLMKAGITSEERWQLAHDAALGYLKKIPDRTAEKKLRDLEYSLIGCKIPGFFPTPRKIVERMLIAADIRSGMTVLEPSAGKGDIAEAIRESRPGCVLTCVEWSHTLGEILRLKNFPWVLQEDFLEHSGSYDRIVMNPPFEDGLDIDHVRHAFDCLKPGGRLVAIMSEGPFFREFKKDVEFRDWLACRRSRGYRMESAFVGAEAFRQTGVTTRIVIIERPL